MVYIKVKIRSSIQNNILEFKIKVKYWFTKIVLDLLYLKIKCIIHTVIVSQRLEIIKLLCWYYFTINLFDFISKIIIIKN